MAEKKSASPSGVLRFGVFQVNLAAREIRKHGIRVRLPGQPFHLLSMLLEKPGEIVTREEMRRRLWPSDTFVDFQHSLNSAIKKLRAALGDSSENSRYIETVPRVGYRFIAPVEQASALAPSPANNSVDSDRSPGSAMTQQLGKPSWKSRLGIPALVMVISVAYVSGSYFRIHPPQSNSASETNGGLWGREPLSSVSPAKSSPKSAEAHDLYLKGMYFWNKRTVAGFQQAIEYFQQATSIDPNYALAYAGLANSYTLLPGYASTSGALYIPQARAAASRALELDGDLAEAHTALALIVQNYDWDWQTAEREYRRAIELNPNYATAHQWYAEHLMWLERFDQASRESERARQLDPLSLIIAADACAIQYYSRQYDKAVQQCRAVLRKDPTFIRAAILVTYAYVERRLFAQASDEAKTLSRIYGEGPAIWMALAYIYGRAGQLDRGRHELEKLDKISRQEQVNPVTMLWAHLGIGNKEEALADLEKAYSEHFGILTTLKVEPAFDPLRSDPRFQDLLRRVGLADNATSNADTRKP